MKFASTALFRRNGQLTFRPPRIERSTDKTQARKSASRYWTSAIKEPDRIGEIFVVRWVNGAVSMSIKEDGNWREFHQSYELASQDAPVAACLKLLGADPKSSPEPLPETLEINGILYRREI